MKDEEYEECMGLRAYRGFMARANEIIGMDQERYMQLVPTIVQLLLDRQERDPIMMYEGVMEAMDGIWTASPQLPVHGAWHHFLVPGIIIRSLQNCGYPLTDGDVMEAVHRGMMIPGGGCGFHGACGAGTGVGIAISIVMGSNPLHDGARSRSLEASAEAYRRIARLGGPRCCPLSTYTAMKVAETELDRLGYPIPISSAGGRCPFSEKNPECHGESCPYRPRRTRE